MTQPEQHRLPSVFDDVAEHYDAIRPTYPAALYDDILALTQLPDGGDLLEIGCGTGQATLPFARRGYRIDCIELGARLAAIARRHLAPYPRVAVRVGDFETEPLAEAAYDLVYSATAFHWITPASYPKVAQILRPDGAVALFWNKHITSATDGGFFDRVQSVYRQHAPELYGQRNGLPTAETLPDESAALAATGLFHDFTTRHYSWARRLDTSQYLALLDTYSDHHALPAARRQRLYTGIGEIAEREYGGQITMEQLTVLYVAQRR